MHQKEVILSRVDDMTQEYMDPPPVDPLTGDPDQTLKKVDETAELRTNIGFAIEHAMSLQQMNEAEKGSLNSLLGKTRFKQQQIIYLSFETTTLTPPPHRLVLRTPSTRTGKS